MTNRKAILAALVTIGAISLTCHAQDKIVLKQNYPTGVFLITSNMDMTQKITVDGQAQPDQHTVMDVSIKMAVGQPNEKGLRKAVMTFERLKQTVQVGDEKHSFDSAEPAENQPPELTKIFGALTSVKITMTIGRDGDITEIGGLSAMWDDMAKGEPALAQMMAQMKEQMGDEMISQMIKKGMEFLPTKAVGVGDKWVTSMEVPAPIIGKISYAMDTKVSDIRKQGGSTTATLEFTGTAKVEPGQKTDAMGAKLTIKKLDFQQSGTIIFDATQCMATSSVMKQAGKIEMTVENSGNTSQVSLDQAMKATTTVQAAKETTTSAPAPK